MLLLSTPWLQKSAVMMAGLSTRRERHMAQGPQAGKLLILHLRKHFAAVFRDYHGFLRLAHHASCFLYERRESLDDALLPKGPYCYCDFYFREILQQPSFGEWQLPVAADFVKDLPDAEVSGLPVGCLHEHLGAG